MASSYGKRPLWQWVVIYVIVGVIVYGLIYYFAFSKNGGYNSNSYQAPTQSTKSSGNEPGGAAGY